MINPYVILMGFGHAIVDLSQGVLPIIIPILSIKLGLSFFQVGTIALAFTFSSAIIQPAFGIMSDRYNMAWLMPLGLFISGFGLALTGKVNSYLLLIIAVLISGMGVAGYHPEASKLTHRVSEEKKRGAAMSVFSLGGNLGYGIGPMLTIYILGFSGLDSIHGIIIPGLLASLIFFFLLPKFNKILKAPSSKPVANDKNSSKAPSKETVKTNKGHLLLLMLYVTIRSWIHAGIIYYIPFYFPMHLGIQQPQYLISIFLISGALGTIIGGLFADRFGERKGLLLSMIISLFTVLPFMHLDGILAPVLAFIVGTALISTFSITVVFCQKLMPNNVGLASGLVLGFAVGTGSLGVTLLGFIADYTGLPFIMAIISALPILGIILAFFLPNLSEKTTNQYSPTDAVVTHDKA